MQPITNTEWCQFLRNLSGEQRVMFEGTPLLLTAEPIAVGDTYLACRNTGPKLLTARAIGNGCIHPCETGYSFDLCECRKVTFIDE